MKQLFKSQGAIPTEVEAPSFIKSLGNSLQRYQTVIFFILLVISLIIFLLLWRSYRLKQMAEKGWLELERVSRIEDFQSLLGVYGSTELAPLIHYKLANAYFEAERYPDARKEYEFVLKKYPQHFVSQLISQRLKEQKVNEVWSAGELSKHRDELSTKRDLPAVLIKTKKGECEIELYEDDAPNTVANFISLVEQGFYREVCFGPKDEKFGLSLNVLHTPGTPTITAPITTTLNFTIPFETNSLKNKEGSLGMLREIDPDTKTGRPERDKFINSACWKCYIALKPNPDLDGKYTIFGWVTKGMNIIKELQPGDVIDEIVIKKKRAHNYKPTVLPLPR